MLFLTSGIARIPSWGQCAVCLYGVCGSALAAKAIFVIFKVILGLRSTVKVNLHFAFVYLEMLTFADSAR
jgi:hypothetical protein